MADTRDLKSLVKYLAYGFESRLRHFPQVLARASSSAQVAQVAHLPPSGGFCYNTRSFVVGG